MWSPLWTSQLPSSASGICVVSPLWLYCLGMRTLWEPRQAKGGLRGCSAARSLLYPANDACHFCSQSTGQKWSRGRSSYRGAGELGDIHGYVVSINCMCWISTFWALLFPRWINDHPTHTELWKSNKVWRNSFFSVVLHNSLLSWFFHAYVSWVLKINPTYWIPTTENSNS